MGLTHPLTSGGISPTPPDWSGRSPSTLVPVEPQPMTDWFQPAQLVATAGQVVVSTVLGAQADHRALEALQTGGSPSSGAFDFSDRKTITLDYVADTGDGWDSTYTLAYHLAQPSLAPAGGGSLPRGEVLVFGGDEVYPTPGRAAYERKLVAPYETAMALSPDPDRTPEVFAIPGNHDWYDSLVTFTRLFLAKDWFAGWRTRQTRSYFALKLPQGWWLMGVDVQLASDLDPDQVAYFEAIAKDIPRGDRIILCLPEPHWIYQQERDTGRWDRTDWERPGALGPDGQPAIRTNLEYLECHLFKGQVQVMLAGDLHHYRRHAGPDGRQKIVAGGGGAFMHLSHPWSEAPLADGATLQRVWPEPAVSRRLAWQNLGFPLLHKPLGWLIGLAYLLVGWNLQADLSPYGLCQFGGALGTALLDTIRRPGGAFMVLGLLGAFVLFAPPTKRRFRIGAGFTHGLAHLGLCFLLGWGATRLAVTVLGFPFQGFGQLLLGGLILFLGGWLAGTMLFGLYLAISINGFHQHWTEASSGLAIPDWKHFLRLCIAEDGSLTIHPIGFRRVPRRWKAGSADPTGPRLEPDDPAFTGPELIEPPIRVAGRGTP